MKNETFPSINFNPGQNNDGSHPEQTLHFSAANGFPLGAYRHFLAPFYDQYTVIGLENRGAWRADPPHRAFGWTDHANDIITMLEQRRQKGKDSKGIIAIGHSIGGTVSALAAHKRPDLFRAVIMIDPASPPGRYFWRLPKQIIQAMMRRHRLVTGTSKRRFQWPSRHEFISTIKEKAVYRDFSTIALQEYAEAGLIKDDNGGFELRYDRAWEAHNFLTTHAPWPALRKSQTPTLLLRAEKSYMHKPEDFEFHSKRLPACVDTAVIRGAGHMAIQEDTDQVTQICKDWLRKQGLLSPPL